MGKEIDPSDVGKYPELIKKAQAEMTTLDVLVCGQCHSSFHFIEQFNEHKSPSCTKSSKIKDSTEQRPVVWAFLLWKAAQLNQEPNKDSPPQWCIYQQWIKLDDAIKETWIVAGRTIQSFSRIGLGQLQEMPVKITKTVVDNATNSGQKPRPPPQQVTRPGQRDLDSAFNALKQAETKKIINRSPQHKLPINAVARPVAKPGGISRIALRTLATSDEGTETEEHTIEKILAKRFNPRLKEHEYLIKWQGMSHETNTWEPLSHLSSCPVLLDTFEKQLAKQKEQRALQEARKTQSAGVVIKEEPEVATKKRKIDATEASKLVNQAKSNGITFSNAIKQETSAEVVITSAKDGKPTGIVKKTGITVNPITKNEAQVKVIPKGGDSVSGVVRVTPNKPVQQHGNTTVKPVQNVSRASVAAPKPAIQRSTQQTVSYQSTTVAPAPKPTISRVVKNAPTPKQITPEQKIAALTRQGDLKITRKPVAQQPALPQATVVVADEEDFTVREDFELNIPAAVPNELVQGADSELALLQHEQQEDGTVLMTDQDGIQQILATTDDGQQQLIQFVTGEDGTIYQVAGKNEQGQTVLIAQGADGEQQCVYVAAEEGDGLMTGEDVDNGLLTVDGNLVEDAQLQEQQQAQHQLVDENGEQVQYTEVPTDASAIPLSVATDDADSQDGQITAEVVQADLPSPGGTRRVVLQLPDGSFMVTEVDEEQFKALNMQG